MATSKLKAIAVIASLGILGMTGDAYALPGHAAVQKTGKAKSPSGNTTMSSKHILPSTSGAMLSGKQVLQRCQAAYLAVKTLDETVHSLSNHSPAGAHILFQSPTTLRVSGQTLFPGQKYDMISDGKSTSVLSAGQWQQEQSAELGIAAITGISGSSGSTVPAILAHAKWGNIFVPSSGPAAQVAMETINGQKTYRVSLSTPSKRTADTLQRIYWVNSHTFFLVKSSTQFSSFVSVVTYDKPIINKPIPASAFQK